MTSSEPAGDALVGRRLLQLLKKNGYVITPLTVDRLLRVSIPVGALDDIRGMPAMVDYLGALDSLLQ